MIFIVFYYYSNVVVAIPGENLPVEMTENATENIKNTKLSYIQNELIELKKRLYTNFSITQTESHNEQQNNKKNDEKRSIDDNSQAEEENCTDHKYYHIFTRKELEEIIERTRGLRVVESCHMKRSWIYILTKI